MIKTQKIIKYIAIAFALCLTVNIISMVMYGIISIGSIFDNDNNKKETLEDFKISENIKSLDIDIISSNIIVKESSNIKIETNNKYIKINENNHKVSISEEKHNWLNKNDTSDLVIYIPSTYIFDDVSIDNGAGKIEVETLNTKKLELDLGAGKVDINNLTVSNNTDIDGGAGEITITNANLNNLDLDMGIGKVTITSKLTGNNEISAGVGTLYLNPIGTMDDYKIIIDKGIGNATLNSEKMQNSTYYGNGSNLINIDGGVGAIKINLVNNNLL